LASDLLGSARRNLRAAKPEELQRVVAQELLLLARAQEARLAHELAHLLLAERERVVGAEHDALVADGLDQHRERVGAEHGGVEIEAVAIVRGRVLRDALDRRVMLPPPCAKQILRARGRRSKAPPKIIATSVSCVSAGMLTVHAIMKRRMRSPPSMSQGCTSTAAFSAAQCWRNATMPSSSKSLAPTWLPSCTPRCPAFIARESSLQARSGSWSGTWQSAARRPPLLAHISSAASL